MFDLDSATDEKYLSHIEARICFAELHTLATEPGFTDPNQFPFERILAPLKEKQFPLQDHYEYCWAIYECGFDRIERCSKWVKLYLASLYIYCNKRKQWGLKIESDYYYMVISAETNEGVTDCSQQFLRFLEWLHEDVVEDEGYDNYYLLLSWSLLRRLRNEVSDCVFQDVLRTLISKQYSADNIFALTVSERGGSAWYDLYRSIPMPLNYVETYEFDAIVKGQ